MTINYCCCSLGKNLILFVSLVTNQSLAVLLSHSGPFSVRTCADNRNVMSRESENQQQAEGLLYFRPNCLISAFTADWDSSSSHSAERLKVLRRRGSNTPIEVGALCTQGRDEMKMQCEAKVTGKTPGIGDCYAQTTLEMI